MEYFDKGSRRVVYCLSQLFGHGTGVFLPLISYFNRDYLWMHIWVALLSVIALPTYFLVPESARWLACNHRCQEAEDILMNVAKTNKRIITDEQSREIRAILGELSKSQRAKTSKSTRIRNCLSMTMLFRGSFLYKTLILMLCWVSGIVSVYALLLNMEDLAGDMFVNFLVSMFTDVPIFVYVFFVCDRWGRRNSLISVLFLLTLSLLAMAWTPKDFPKLVFLIYSVGKFSAGTVSSICWLYTAELYPTNLRSQAIGFCSLVSRQGKCAFY